MPDDAAPPHEVFSVFSKDSLNSLDVAKQSEEWKKLADCCYQIAVNKARAYAQDHASCLDISQEMLQWLWIKKAELPSTFGPGYLNRIISRDFIDYIRKDSRRKKRELSQAEQLRIELHDLLPEPTPDEDYTENPLLLKAIRQACSQLEPPTGDMILMKYELGMTQPEIATKLGLTQSNVGVILKRALQKVRNRLQVHISTPKGPRA